MNIPRRTLDCGCAYELRSNKDSLIAFSGDIVFRSVNECDTANALLSAYRSKFRDGNDEATLQAYYDHVWGALQRSAAPANVG